VPVARRGFILLWSAVMGLAACFQAQSDQPVPQPPVTSRGSSGGSRGRGGTGSGTAGGASAGGASSSGSGPGGSSSGGASSGSGGSSGSGSTGTSGGSSGGSTGAQACGGGSLAFATRFLDLGTNQAITGLTVTAYGIDGLAVPGAVGTTDQSGQATICNPAGQEVYFGLEGQGYPPSYTEDFVQTGPLTQTSSVLLISTSDLPAVQVLLQEPLVATDSIVVAVVDVEDASSPCKAQIPGWTFSLLAADGGALPPGPDGGSPFATVYMNATGIPDPALRATSTQGAALLYNVDPANGAVELVGVNGNADAGACPPLVAPVRVTGRSVVSSGSITFDAIELP